MQKIFEGTTVLDFSVTEAGAGAAALMADYGATVIKIESPAGDPCRNLSPKFEGESLIHCWLNRGKKSLVLDIADPTGAAVAKKLMEKADVVVESFMPGFMDSLGLGYSQITASNPGLVYCSVTTFGQQGPYRNKRGNDLMAQALSGIMAITGEAEGPPEKHGVDLGNLAGAQSAYGAISAALCQRLNSGEGQYIDVSTMRILIWLNSAVDRVNAGVYSRREGNHHPALSPFGLFYGNNGQSVIICALNPKIWNSICGLIGHPEYEADPRYSSVSARTANRFEVIKMLETWLKTFDSIEEPMELLSKANVPSCQVYGMREVLVDKHYTHPEVGWLIDAPCPDSLQAKGAKTYRTCGTNVTMSVTSGVIGKAPDLGQHSVQVLREAGISEEAIRALNGRKGGQAA